MKEYDLTNLLSKIDPTLLDYNQWTAVGMALKEEGYSVSDWEAWSARDAARYHPGECEKKWNSFNGNGTPVTGGTIYQLATEQGWKPEAGREIAWDDVIWLDEPPIIETAWVEEREIEVPTKWDPAKQIITYLETLFESGDYVGYVVQSRKSDKGKYIPANKGSYSQTCDELIDKLRKYKDDIGAALGDYNPEAGAWIRFNPLDGKGVRNENVASFRYALVESDSLEIEKQNALLRELELPIACLVFSGGKSLHAIVRIEAIDEKEYKERVNFLYSVCEKNGLSIDSQNRNPSRLSRLPGVTRGDNKQYIIDTNLGKKSWSEWKEFIEGANDDLPDVSALSDAWDNMPNLAEELIEGVLRMGHKMLITGPSKAGKSFLQIELCIAIAEGIKWLGKSCKQGRVLYVNLELDEASCFHRFKDVYTAWGIKANNLKNIDIWNLRGRSVPMDKLAPRLIRRARKKNYTAIIIDPIYKVITGDENSADQMAHFCNQFDLICTELKCSVIYCHHHSKGSQGQKKSMDRASGSGVFARDPDALLDMVELELTDALKTQESNKAACNIVRYFLENHVITKWNWKEEISQDSWLNSRTLLNICENNLPEFEFGRLKTEIETSLKRSTGKTAWRIDGTLREFPKFDPINVWFEYPIHNIDDIGSLSDIQPETNSNVVSKKTKPTKKSISPEENRINKLNKAEIAFENLQENGLCKMQDLAIALGYTDTKNNSAGHRFGLKLGTGQQADEDLKECFEKVKKEVNGIEYTFVKRKV